MAPTETFLTSVSERLTLQIQAFEPKIAPYAEYALSVQGKQLRPVLVGLSGLAFGPLTNDHVNIAAIIEMVHLATLVHDDIMDEASVRRGRPTVAANWGSEVSVLLGDCLFAHALELAAAFPTTEVCRLVSGATKRVCTGEILQTLRRGDFTVNRGDYLKMVQMKTAELFAVACDLGGFASGTSAEKRAALRDYGTCLGTAYQIYDDCLDLFGSERVVGKSLGTDLATGKLTLPLLLALESADPKDREVIFQLLERWNSSALGEMLAVLQRNRSLDRTKVFIKDYLEEARTKLLTAGICDESDRGLAALPEFLSQQMDGLGVVNLKRT